MSLKDAAVELARRFTGAHIYRVLPRGLDLLHDLRNGLPHHQIEIILDVGANIGQSALKYLPWFPHARVYCFEPVRETFDQLQANLAGQARVRCFPLALGAEEGQARMVLSGASDMSRIERVLPGRGAGAIDPDATSRVEQVQMTTLDRFCGSQGLDRIHYLKVDAEGTDLDVLRGSEALLTAKRIDVIEVEAGMNPTNTTHVPWHDFSSYLEARGYLLFGVYEQVTEWPSRQPHLRRANLAFISPALAASPMS
jgi:FkbM family methyltransferase